MKLMAKIEGVLGVIWLACVGVMIWWTQSTRRKNKKGRKD